MGASRKRSRGIRGFLRGARPAVETLQRTVQSTDAAFLSGCGLVALGFGLISLPLGLIVGGCLLIGLAVLSERGSSG